MCICRGTLYTFSFLFLKLDHTCKEYRRESQKRITIVINIYNELWYDYENSNMHIRFGIHYTQIYLPISLLFMMASIFGI